MLFQESRKNMAYNVHITSKAEKDLDDIVTYISEELKNPKAASRILEEFLEEKVNISDNPYMYPLSFDARLQAEGYHRFIFHRNYVALYLIDETEEKNNVWIMRIFNGKINYPKLI